MPNSERVALTLTEAIVGTQVWNGATGECRTMPDADYEATKNAAVAILELVARAIDWPRLVAEAEWRHHKLHRDRGEVVTNYGGWEPTTLDLCGECLHEALLSHGYEGHTQDWVAEPKVARRAGAIDWPTIVAQMVNHRSPEYRERLAAKTRELHDAAATGPGQ